MPKRTGKRAPTVEDVKLEIPQETPPDVVASSNGNGAQPNGTATSQQTAAPTKREGRAGRPITIDDIVRIKLVGEPSVSPDGRTVAVAVSTLDLDADTTRAAIWLVPVAGGEPAQLTSGAKNDTSPRWSPDGETITFLSNRDTEKAQLWVIPVHGGEARRLTSLDNAVADPVWSPDGRQIAFVAKLTPPDPNPNSDVKVITSVRYKFDGEGFLEGKHRHIWTIEVGRDGAVPVRLTDGDFEHTAPAWSPTGHEIAFSTNRNPEWEFEWSRDLWTVSPASKQLRRLTSGDCWCDLPAWSPDGRSIACFGTKRLDLSSPNHELWVLPAAGGEPVSLTADFDRSLGDHSLSDTGRFPAQRPVWRADGSAIAALVSDQGETQAIEVSVDDHQISHLTTGPRRVTAIAPAAADTWVIATSDPITPFELTVIAAGGEERALTSFNSEWLSEVAASWPEEIRAKSADGKEVQAWLLRPPQAASHPDVRYPAILEIHGGPWAMYGLSFFHELQLLAANGYVVIFANPRGSAGYGQAWAEDLRGAWGKNDTPDLMACLDAAIARGGIDETRLGVTGGSYGGFMTNWLIGHTDRFRAAVTQRSISNMVSMYGTDDISVFTLDHEMGGPPWEKHEQYWEISPLAYVDNMRTPLLILHSEEDYRCPMEQAEQLFVALKRRRQEVVFVRFPHESHGLSRSGKPKHRLERLRRIVEWFDGHL